MGKLYEIIEEIINNNKIIIKKDTSIIIFLSYLFYNLLLIFPQFFCIVRS